MTRGAAHLGNDARHEGSSVEGSSVEGGEGQRVILRRGGGNNGGVFALPTQRGLCRGKEGEGREARGERERRVSLSHNNCYARYAGTWGHAEA